MLTFYQPLSWFKAQGFRAYLVGNQVRAILLHQENETREIDVATSARPEEILAILRQQKIIPTSVYAQFGVVNFTRAGIKYSFATWREDLYPPQELSRFKRYPLKVHFVSALKKDAQRRDLTINAIYFDPLSRRFRDPLKGLSDWRKKLIRVIGKAEKRFEEDPLRILRVIRFKNALGFHYHPAVLKALEERGSLVQTLSFSVRAKELNKLKEIPRSPEAQRELREFGILKR